MRPKDGRVHRVVVKIRLFTNDYQVSKIEKNYRKIGDILQNCNDFLHLFQLTSKQRWNFLIWISLVQFVKQRRVWKT